MTPPVFDQEQYRQAVLDPALRAGNTPPADLFVRYGFSSARAPRPDEFAAQVEAVAKYWRELGLRRRTYRGLADIMIAAHKTLQQSGLLTAAHFAEEHRRHTAQAGEKLTEAVEDLAAGGPIVAGVTVAAMAARLGGAEAEAALREQLRRRRVRVVDELWQLPASAPARSAGIRNSRKVLGLDLSIAVAVGEQAVRDGFTLRHGLRLAGEPLTEATLRDARARAERQPQDQRKTATESVLTILRTLLADGTLEELVLWELMEAVRPAAELPMTSVPRVARDAAALGLDREEAAEFALAVLMAQQGGGDGRRGAAGEAEELLGAGSLRAAEQLLATVPAEEAGDLRERVRAVAHRVAELAGQAQREISDGRPEHAAELLTAALREAADDTDLAGRLRALAPPPSPGVRAGAGGDRVTVGWTPSAARTGDIGYQVVRTRGRPAGSAADGAVVGRTDGNELVDSAPPAGDDLYYSVFASRPGGAWSTGATAGPVAVLPEIAEVVVTADETSVQAAWTVRADAARVDVVREHDGTAVPATRSGFIDQGLRPGQEYRYVVRVGYPAAGGIVSSAGVLLTAMPQYPPRVVPDLAVEPVPHQAADRLRLAWTPPESGEVVLRSAPHRPRWQRGAEITTTELSGYGEELVGHREPVLNGRAAATTALPSGWVFVTAFSVGGGRAVCGPTVAVTNTAPVTDLRARRVGPAVRLSWDWPAGVALVRIRWWPAGGDPAAARELDCWQRSYRDDGGAQLATGTGPVHVSVATVSRNADEESVGVPAVVRVPGAGVPVRYRFVERSVPFRPTTKIVLSCEQACLLPDLVVVQLPGRVAPLRPDQGTPVARVPAQQLEPGRPVEVPVPVPRSRGPYRLGCFVDDRAAGSDVVLMGTPGGR